MRSRSALLIILAVALITRLLFAVAVVGLDALTKGDEADYHAIAVNVGAGNGFAGEDGKTTGRRPPLYPFLLSLLYRATGPSPASGRIVQVLAGMVVVLLTYLVARRHFEERVALVAAGLSAFNPFLIFISAYLLTENLYVILFLSSFLCVPRSKDPPSLRRITGAAMLLGLSALARPTGLPLAAWVFLSALVLGAGISRMKLVRFALMVAVFLAVTTPWMVRNARTFGGWVGLTTHAGITFYQGNNIKVVEIEHYRGGVAPVGALPLYDELKMMGERERDIFTMQAGKDFLRANPHVLGKLAWWKFKRFWRFRSDVGMAGIRSGWWFDRTSAPGRIAADFDAGLIYAVFAFPLFVAGLFLTRGRWRELALLWGVVIVHTAIALAFFGSIRSRIPVEPVIAIFAAVALTRLLPLVRRRQLLPDDTPHSAPARKET